MNVSVLAIEANIPKRTKAAPVVSNIFLKDNFYNSIFHKIEPHRQQDIIDSTFHFLKL